MNGPMVRAVLSGAKTQTRRIVKGLTSQRGSIHVGGALWCFSSGSTHDQTFRDCPFGVPGDRLWVRETYLPFHEDHVIDGKEFAYGADTIPGSDGDRCRKDFAYKWKPSIHMSRRASRITLEITGVRVERLQDISEEDACAEGCDTHGMGLTTAPGGLIPCISLFKEVWESIHGASSWDANPWVWVVSFTRITAEQQERVA